MRAYNNSHSKAVAWLKVLLPVTGLILLSTMFLISKTIDPTQSLSYARVNLDDVMNEQKISRPSFSSVTEDGAAITFSASTARPEENTNRFSADEMVARIDTPDGASVNINATGAVIDGDAQLIELSGGVTLVTSTDYTITTNRMTAAMNATSVVSDGAVVAEGPAGTIRAGSAEISEQGINTGTYLLVFKDGVKMVYTPKSKGASQ